MSLEIGFHLGPVLTTNEAKTDSTCLDILNRATNIFDRFQHELQMACIQWTTAPIQQLLTLFPDIQSAEGEDS